MRQRVRQLVWAVSLVGACGKPDRGSANASAAAEPSDSLVARTSAGVEIWFTLSRSARAASGRSCVERGLEIRREGRSLQVPLLYTGETPILLNDSTMRAVLWTDCRAVTPYRVDLRTGQPVREQGNHPGP